MVYAVPSGIRGACMAGSAAAKPPRGLRDNRRRLAPRAASPDVAAAAAASSSETTLYDGEEKGNSRTFSRRPGLAASTRVFGGNPLVSAETSRPRDPCVCACVWENSAPARNAAWKMIDPGAVLGGLRYS
ncbi:hypothetical protein HPB50_013006 [Hyalomma asiaticum]|uniref:Uncharacterized protein n=1 Tax=Hyalomma asiaticum TaxID=266040 RepID=A0ACB7S8I6_HYAAI|nr:hypothetical protein HPB50_013006 [Hyalomma asiaticum]